MVIAAITSCTNISNPEVMIRGTFANIRLRNRLAPGTEGGYTRHLPGGEQMTIYDAAQRYAAEGVPSATVPPAVTAVRALWSRWPT